MSETELRVVCKSCGAEVSPYVTECPYCGARVRKRAPKLEQRDGSLEAKMNRREKRRERKARRSRERGPKSGPARPLATAILVLVPAVLLLVRIAGGGDLGGFGGLLVPFDSEWWRFLTAPFAYLSVGYLFVVSLAVVIFVPGIERRLGSIPTLIMLVACGSLGVFAAYGVEEQRAVLEVISGGNGIALGAIAAWYVIERSNATDFEDEKPDALGVLVCVVVIMLLPLVVETANVWSALAGGAVGGMAGLAATLVRK
jgi:membrane associated rhomboid family serine protease